MREYKLAIVGASSVVGEITGKVLEEYNLPISEYRFFDVKELSGQVVSFQGREHEIEELSEESFKESFDYAIFVSNQEVSKKYIPIAVEHKCVCIDRSGYYSMTKGIPLVVPEVNMDDADLNEGIIACPCSTAIEAAVALCHLDRVYRIKRAVCSTYQAVSDAGVGGIQDLDSGIEHYVRNSKHELKSFKYEIFNNIIPQIGEFLEDRYTRAERTMIDETKKVLKRSNIPLTVTSVRVPVFNSNCMSINVEFEKEYEINGLIEVLDNAPGIIVRDDINRCIYPMPIDTNNHDKVFVGRIRRDYSVKSGVNLWVACDNTRKGAASNIVQILDGLIGKAKKL